MLCRILPIRCRQASSVNVSSVIPRSCYDQSFSVYVVKQYVVKQYVVKQYVVKQYVLSKGITVLSAAEHVACANDGAPY